MAQLKVKFGIFMPRALWERAGTKAREVNLDRQDFIRDLVARAVGISLAEAEEIDRKVAEEALARAQAEEREKIAKDIAAKRAAAEAERKARLCAYCNENDGNLVDECARIATRDRLRECASTMSAAFPAHVPPRNWHCRRTD